MEKEKDIEKLFAAAEEDVEPKKELLTPALYELKKQNARKKAKRNRIMKFGTAFSAAVVLIVALSVLLPRFIPSDKKDSEPSAPAYYTAAEISPVSSPVLQSLNIPVITHVNGDAALPESVKEYKFEDGETAYAQVEYRRKGRYGVEDVKIIAEFADGVYEEFAEFYGLLSDSFRFYTRYEGGEYIASCAVERDGVKYYLDIMCPTQIDIDYYRKLFD